jgi:ATP-dependent Lon protease, bacterial type
MVLDEIDKVNADFKGDPSSALLEVLDPEQNSTFHDNYLDIDFDLSRVLFIATANTTQTISQPLLDRMEMIDVSGYITEDKIEIAHRHLIPRQRDNHGIKKDQITIPKITLKHIIESYTRESGVRDLERKIAKIMRQVAKKDRNRRTVRHSRTAGCPERVPGHPTLQPRYLRRKRLRGCGHRASLDLRWWRNSVYRNQSEQVESAFAHADRKPG